MMGPAAAVELLASTWKAIAFLYCPTDLAAKLEVSNQATASSVVRGRSVRGGGNVAMVDGSVQDNIPGVGVWYHQDHSLNLSARINGAPDNNRAELAAIFLALLRHPRHDILTMHTDNSHALARMRRLAMEGPGNCTCVLTWAIATLVHLRSARTLVKKIKAHNGNPSHDMADSLAKIGTRASHAHAVPEGESCNFFVLLHLLGEYILGESAQWVLFVTGKAQCGPSSQDRPQTKSISKTAAGPKAQSVTLRPPKPLNDDHSVTHLLGIDCEMVGVGPEGIESALARVCIVNKHGNVLMDEYARPPVKITDYRTPFSGIRACDLVGAAPARDVQQRVAKLVVGRVLVGHGLDNDLAVLALNHPRSDIRDTSEIPAFCYRRRKGRPRKLRDVAAHHLGLGIQGGEHSPVDDARAAIYLYKAFEARAIR